MRQTEVVDPTTRLDSPAFDGAVDELIETLEILRTWFLEQGHGFWARELDRDLETYR